MGSRQPGVQQSNPLSSKGFPEENSTWCPLGQRFPGCLSSVPRASSSSTHPNCLTREQQSPSPVSHPGSNYCHSSGQLRIWRGRELKRVISDTSSSAYLGIEAGGILGCLCVCLWFFSLFLHAYMKFPSQTKQNSSLWRKKVFKRSASLNMCHSTCVISKNVLWSYFQTLSLTILN